MHLIAPDAYDRVFPCIQELDYNLVIYSILDGNTPGWVFVDDLKAPRSVLLWNMQDAVLLEGEPDKRTAQDVADILASKIVPHAKPRYIPSLSLQYAPEGWEQYADLLLGRWKHKLGNRYNFEFKRLPVGWVEKLPAGFTLQRIDAELLNRKNLPNYDQLSGWINSFWRSYRHFLDTGVGYCVLFEDTIASWCLSVYVSGSNFELGLATDPAFRGQGLATVGASACVAYCQTEYITPHWHCWADNLPSVAVAEKVGFKKSLIYPAYRFEL